MEIWRHIKTGNLYSVLTRATDCTNSRDGTPVVIYERIDDFGNTYVREAAEFAEKFELHSSRED